jgi:hypothetical protein
MIMNAHKIEAVLAEDGKLILNGLPFHAGDVVEVIILERFNEQQASEVSAPPAELYPLQGKQPYRYEHPFESATSIEDWEALK